MTKICRTCLQEISDSSFIFCLNSKDSKSKAISVRYKLQHCIPELDLDIIPNAVICSSCFESLNLAVSFKNKCLEVEGRIQKYIEKIGYVFAYIDLKEIADSNASVVENTQEQETDLTNLHCDTRNFFAVPKIAQLLADGEDDTSSMTNPFECVHCGYTTFSKPDLANHENIHLHKCNECNFTAPKRQTLIIHKRQHLKNKSCCYTLECQTDKRFKCKICNYKARLKCDLKSHMKSHKVHACFMCDFTSFHKEKFIRHVKTHTKPQYTSFCCYKCGYETLHKANLEKHMFLHNKTEARARLNLHIKSNGNNYSPKLFTHSSTPNNIKINMETTTKPTAIETCIKN